MHTDQGKQALSEGFEPAPMTLADGDCGILIQADGKVRLFRSNMPMERLQQPFESLAPADQQLLKNAELLTVMSVIAANPDLQKTILRSMVSAGAATIETANSNAG